MTTVEGVTLDAGLERYGNGRLPLDMLEEVGYRHFVAWAPCARAYRVLRKAAAADGITLVMTGRTLTIRVGER